MKRQLSKHRFFLLACILQIMYIGYFNILDYYQIIYYFPGRTIELCFALSLILSNGYFLIDNIYHYTRMHNEIFIRINKTQYWFLFVKKMIPCLGLLILSQTVFNYAAISEWYILSSLLYYVLFIIVFLCICKILRTYKEDVFILIFMFLVIFIRFCIAFLISA